METLTETFQNLYVHFPFCEAKCHYCDFFSLPESKIPERNPYYAAILDELQFYTLGQVRTVFLGGGTPSLVPLPFLEDLFKKISLAPNAEVTIEANPSSITLEKAKAWRSFGINRVSMGVQALDDARLEWLGRVHSKTAAFEALEALMEAGFQNFSIDYILGVPGQSVATIEQELSLVLGRYPGLKHMSAYLLTLKPSNPKFKELPHEDEQLAHLRAASAVLQAHGFEHYEVSNFAKPGFTSRHNQNYWSGNGYLGIGPSGHSYAKGATQRFKNWASLEKYRSLVGDKVRPVELDETLTLEQERIENILLQLRRKEGLNLRQHEQRFGQDLAQKYRSLLETWAQKGYCKLTPDTLSLTPEGFYVSDQIISKII